MWWSINGHLFPKVPMYVVREGDVVLMHIENRNGEVHPMHLHGHHVVVLARNGVAATGSPWWVDSLNVLPNETYDIAFVADNPGIWMDHCHNLKHAAQGMIAHLMYEGFDTPYRIAGPADNQPEGPAHRDPPPPPPSSPPPASGWRGRGFSQPVLDQRYAAEYGSPSMKTAAEELCHRRCSAGARARRRRHATGRRRCPWTSTLTCVICSSIGCLCLDVVVSPSTVS